MGTNKAIISYCNIEKTKNEDKFTPQIEKLSSSIVQSWTPQALTCYQLGCDCTQCEISQLGFSFVCQMKNVVEELLKKGEPDKKDLEMCKSL